jgi:hypothetical protein
LRAPTVFSARIKTIRAKNTVMDKNNDSAGFYTRSPIAYGQFFVRAQSVIRADGFSSAQYHSSATGRNLSRHV